MPDHQRPPPLTSIPLANSSALQAAAKEVNKSTRERSASFDESFNEHVLLTPPPNAASGNPLDSLRFTSSPIRVPVHPGGATLHNHHAHQQNSQYQDVSSAHPGQEIAANLINGLSIRTDMAPPPRRSGSAHSFDSEHRLRSSASASSLPRRAPSVRAALHSTAGSLSPGSVISSPQIAAMLDITPLPSPTMGAFETWKIARTRSRGSSTSSRTADLPPALYPFSPPSPRRKGYPGLTHISSVSDEAGLLTDDSRARTRSISEYVPEALAIPKPRNVAVSTSGPPPEAHSQPSLQREEYLGVQRGIVTPATSSSPHADLLALAEVTHEDEPAPKRQKVEVFTAASINTGQLRKYQGLRELGHGTFSKVLLAVRQVHDRKDTVDYSKDSVNMDGVRARSRRLVAIKVIENGPKGGGDAERIAVSLKREVELLKAIKHPSVVHLKAFGTDADDRALLVMNYCPGGDLFEVASTKLEILTPPLVRRIFAEMVSAVRYLHQKYIVHRDIKLESGFLHLLACAFVLIAVDVLLNIPIQVHADVPNWQTLDRAVVTLTDLGLSRRIPEPPESAMLTTRCGSEDYAAPEILMGQPYDGRQTDAWALGVLLYSLMEGRLPFDPLPGARGDPATLRARTPHRIARCEWAWVRYGDEDGEWDATKGAMLQGAQVCVDSLLKRNTRRKPLAEIREMPWVTEGIKVDGGLRWVEEEAYG